MYTTATLHIHPKLTDPLRVFEIRRLAIIAGCAFITTKPKRDICAFPAPSDPNGGGRAA